MGEPEWGLRIQSYPLLCHHIFAAQNLVLYPISLCIAHPDNMPDEAHPDATTSMVVLGGEVAHTLNRSYTYGARCRKPTTGSNKASGGEVEECSVFVM